MSAGGTGHLSGGCPGELEQHKKEILGQNRTQEDCRRRQVLARRDGQVGSKPRWTDNRTPLQDGSVFGALRLDSLGSNPGSVT